MIHKNPIPILEYDDDPSSLIMPDHDKLGYSFPEKCVFAFAGEYIDRYAKAHGAYVAGEFVSATKIFPVYVLERAGERFTLCQAPVGSAAAAQLLDWLIGYGVRKVISCGSCGALEDFAEGTFLVPYRALRDEGASYHYAPPSRFIDTEPSARRAIETALTARGLKYREVLTWSTDGFYRETRARTAYRREEGCSVVEMECAALAACAALRGAVWGEILYTADTLADLDAYDERDWGGTAYEAALELCFDAVLRL